MGCPLPVHSYDVEARLRSTIIVDIDIILFSFLGDSWLFIIFFYFIFFLSIVTAKIECNIIFSSISSLPESSEVSESVHNSERLL
jgi:hypothetical protein